ncbi:MAG: PAS domain S-box protein, partial [archaeon]|nr:PAS domain S-box protein [archaeon]
MIEILDDKTLDKSISTSERFFQDLMKYSNEIFFKIEENGNFTFLNSIFSDLTGYSKKIWTIREIRELIHPNDRIIWDQIYITIDEKKSLTKELRYRKKNGEYFYLLVNISKIGSELDSDLYSGYARDISEKKIIEQELKESEEIFRLTFENAADAIFWIELESGIIINCNNEAEILLERKKEEILGFSQQIISISKEDNTNKMLSKIKEEGIPLKYESIIKTKFQKIVPVHIGLSLTLIGGKPIIQGIFRDITELKKVEEKFSKIFNSSPAICGLGRQKDGKFVDVNDSFCELLGFSREEAIGRTSVELGILTLKDRVQMTEEIKKNKGRLENYEISVYNKAGDELNVLFFTELINIENENYLLISAIDITHRKKFEKALKLSEEKFSKAFMSSPTLYSISTLKDGKFIEINNTFCNKLGISREEVIGRTAVDLQLLKHEDRVKMKEEIEKSGKLNNFQMNYSSITGEKFVGAFSAEMIEFGNKKCLLISVVDITERKKAEDNLRKSEEKFSKAFRLSPTLYGISNLENGRFIEVNDSFCNTLEMTREEIIGKNSVDLQILRQDDLIKTIEEQINGLMNNYEIYFYTKSGKRLTGLLSTEMIEFGNEKCAFISIIDITERKKTEEALAARLKYEKGIANCSKALLANTNNSVEKAISYLLDASGASRVYIFKNFDDEIDGLCMCQTHEIVARGVHPEIDNPELQHIPYKDSFPRWKNKLKQGESISGLVRDFPIEEREILEPQDILSILIIPIHVFGKWWGFIGFDDTQTLRKWSPEDISLLNTTAGNIGGYIGHKKSEEKLRENEENLRYAQKIAHLGSWEWKVTTNKWELSEEMINIYELNLENTNVVDMSVIMKLFHPADLKKMKLIMKKSVEDQKTGLVDYRIITPRGNEKWIRADIQVFSEASGKTDRIIGVGLDITERKKTEEKLIFITKAFENSSDAIGITDREGYQIFQNQAFVDLFEYNSIEDLDLVGGLEKIFVDQDHFFELFKSLKSGNSWTGEIEMMSKSSRKYDVLLRADAIKDENNNIIGLIGVYTDISEKKKSEEDLKRSEENLKSAQQIAHIGSFEWDYNLKELTISEELYRIYGIDDKKFNLSPTFLLENVIHPKDREIIIDLIKNNQETKENWSLEYHINTLDEKIKTVRAEGRFSLDSEENPIKLIGTVQDITKSKEAEEALRKSEERLRIISENANEVIWTCGLDLKFIYVSPVIEKLIGYTPEEILEIPISDYMTPKSFNIIAKTLRKAILKDKKHRDLSQIEIIELEEIHKEGHSVFVEITSTFTRDSEGNPTGILGVTRDISERKRAEERIKQKTEDLTRSNEELQQFAYVASHDLSSPLLTVASYLELLEGRYSEKLDERGLKYIDRAL